MGSVDPWRWKLCRDCDAAGLGRPTRANGCSCRVTSWRARWRNDEGKSRSQVFKRKLDADRHIAKVEGDKLTGVYVDPRAGRITVRELGETLIVSKQDPNTRAWYRTMFRHVDDRWGRLPVLAVDHLGAQRWVDKMTADGVGPDTVRGAFRVLHEIIGLALRARRIGFDPCRGVRLPPVNRREMLFLTPAQIVLIATTIEATWPGEGWGLLCEFAPYSGCRAGECGGLKVKHFDLENCRVQIVGARKSHGRDGKTKTGKKRWVDLPRQLCDKVAAHIEERDLGPEDRIWVGERGGPLNHKWFYRQRFKPVVIALADQGLLPVLEVAKPNGTVVVLTLRFHDYRHTCVALLIAKGAQQYEVMEHLGHSNIQTTINTYGHLFPSVRERIRTALEETWDEAA